MEKTKAGGQTVVVEKQPDEFPVDEVFVLDIDILASCGMLYILTKLSIDKLCHNVVRELDTSVLCILSK